MALNPDSTKFHHNRWRSVLGESPRKKRRTHTTRRPSVSDETEHEDDVNDITDEKFDDLVHRFTAKMQRTHRRVVRDRESKKTEILSLTEELERRKREHQEIKYQDEVLMERMRTENGKIERELVECQDERDALKLENERRTKKMETLNGRVEALQSELALFEGDQKQMDALNLKQLNELEVKLLNALRKTQQSREALMESNYKCIACTVRKKNISFVDGCNHVALCEECEAYPSRPKTCPICQMEYSQIKKLNL